MLSAWPTRFLFICEAVFCFVWFCFLSLVPTSFSRFISIISHQSSKHALSRSHPTRTHTFYILYHIISMTGLAGFLTFLEQKKPFHEFKPVCIMRPLLGISYLSPHHPPPPVPKHTHPAHTLFLKSGSLFFNFKN